MVFVSKRGQEKTKNQRNSCEFNATEEKRTNINDKSKRTKMLIFNDFVFRKSTYSSLDLHRSIHRNHFIVIVWIVEHIVNILLTCCASHNRCSAMPISRHISAIKKDIDWFPFALFYFSTRTRLTCKIHCVLWSDKSAIELCRSQKCQ